MKNDVIVASIIVKVMIIVIIVDMEVKLIAKVMKGSGGYMSENKRYVRILDHSEKEVRIFDEHNQKNIFNIFFMGLDSAICLKGALEDTVDLLNELSEEIEQLKSENQHIKNTIAEALANERTHMGQNVLKQLLEAIQ